MCFELEEKLEFPSYLPLSLVPHWIGDGRLGSIYTNTSHAYCYECWAMGHIPTRAHTRRSEPGRAGCGWRAPRPGDMNAVRFRGLLDLLHFVFYFLFKILLGFFGNSWTRSRESDLHVGRLSRLILSINRFTSLHFQQD